MLPSIYTGHTRSNLTVAGVMAAAELTTTRSYEGAVVESSIAPLPWAFNADVVGLGQSEIMGQVNSVAKVAV